MYASHLLCGAFFSKGLWGLVAMLASSASQLVLEERLNSWCDTPDPTWNNPGDLWSSSTSCRSGMSSEGRSTATLMTWHKEKLGFLTTRRLFWDFTIFHVTPGWGRQVLVALEQVKRFVHSHTVLPFPLFLNRLLVCLLSFHHCILPHQQASSQNKGTKNVICFVFCCFGK